MLSLDKGMSFPKPRHPLEQIKNQSSGCDVWRPYFDWVFPYLDDGCSLLNLGSGTAMSFERGLLQKCKIDITAIDRSVKVSSLSRVEYIQQSVDSPFNLQKKFSVVCSFEVLEHVDNTDVLIKNMINHVEDDGFLFISYPNLSSLWARFELLCGYQPHCLEISNEKAGFGQGLTGKLNNPGNIPLHHIRGITYRAMCELLEYNGLKIIWARGSDWYLPKAVKHIPSIASINVILCKIK